jgi:PAS domain S-box-containing protein
MTRPGLGRRRTGAAFGPPQYQRALLEAQHEALPDGILVVSRDGKMLSFNRRFLEMWGIPPEVSAARSDAAAIEAIAPLLCDPAEFEARVRYLYAHPEVTSREEIPLKDGRIFERFSATVRRPRGAPYGRLWIFRDITTAKQAEAARAQLIQEQTARQAALQRSIRLRALHDAILALAAPVGSEPQDVAARLDTIAERAVAAVGASTSWLVLAEDAAWRGLPAGQDQPVGRITVVRARGGGIGSVLMRHDGATMHVLTTGEKAVVPDTIAASCFGTHPDLAHRGILSFVVLPLQADGQTIGALGAGFSGRGNPAEDEWMALELFAAHAGAALQRVRLAAAEHRRATQAECLAAVLAQVGAAAEFEAALEALARGAVTLLDGAHGVVRTFGAQPGERLLELVVTQDGRLNVRRNPPPLLAGSYGRVLQAGGPPSVVDDFWALDPAVYHNLDNMKRDGLRAAVNVPLESGGRRIGSLHVNHSQPGFFGPADLLVAEALAAQAGAAIERARLETARQAAVAAREQAVLHLAAQSEELAHREAETTALRELDQLKNELLATITHELRTPLTVVHGYAQQLRARAGRMSPDLVQRAAGHILAGSTQLSRLMADLSEFGRAQSGQTLVRPETIDLVPVLTQAAAGMARQPDGERISTSLPPTLQAYADPVRVVQVTSNLIENALKYAYASPVVLSARPSPDHPGYVRVEVQDQGPGVPDEEQPRVWEKFYRGRSVAELNVARGSGIGLSVVKALVEQQGGKVGLHSAAGQGSCFWFEVPSGGA